MDLRLFLIILIIIFAALLAISIIKKLIKIAIIAALIFIIISLITGGSIIGDFNNLKNRLNNEPSVALLTEDNKVIAGIIDREEYMIFDLVYLKEIENYLNKKEYDKIKGDNYKLFIYDVKVIGQLQEIEINNKQVTAQELSNFLSNGIMIKQITKEDILLDLEIAQNNDYQSILFAYLYDKELKLTKSPILFFKNYKEGNIIVYPETMFFKFTKIIPISWIEGKLNKLKGSIINKN